MIYGKRGSGICGRGHDAPKNLIGACTVCQREYQKEYRKEYAPRKKVQDKRRRQEHRLRAIEYLGGRCVDCGNNDNRVFVFDHVRGEKTCNVPTLFAKRWERVLTELEKCELVCANCHLIRTVERIPEPVDTFVGRRERK